MNLSRHQFLGRLLRLVQRGRDKLGNFQRAHAGRRQPAARGRHVLDVVVKSSRQEKLERARRWRRGLQWGALAAAAAALAATSHQAVARYFWQNPDLQLSSGAEIRTNGSLSHDSILRHAGLSETNHVYDVDLRATRERLEALPNVRHASVERALPGRLVIEVEERLPVLWLSCDQPPLRPYTTDPSEGACLIDEEGHLFLCTELRDELLYLPVLHLRRLSHTQPGVHLTTAPVQAGLDLLRRLRDTFGARGLDVAEIDAPNDWSLVAKLTNDLSITIGYDDVDEQLRRLVRVVDVATEQNLRLGTVNLLPRKNVPVTLLGPETATPGASIRAGRGKAVPVASPAPTAEEAQSARKTDQLEAILGGGR